MTMTLYFAKQTEKARLFMFFQKQSPTMLPGIIYGTWIPKRCHTILEEFPTETKEGWLECRVKIKDWFAKQADLEQRRIAVINKYVTNPDDQII